MKEKRSKREKFFGYNGTFYEKGYSQELNDLVVLTKLCRQFINPKTKIPISSSEFSKLYFYFNGNCITRYDSSFVPHIADVGENLKTPSDAHKSFLYALDMCL